MKRIDLFALALGATTFSTTACQQQFDPIDISDTDDDGVLTGVVGGTDGEDELQGCLLEDKEIEASAYNCGGEYDFRVEYKARHWNGGEEFDVVFSESLYLPDLIGEVQACCSDIDAFGEPACETPHERACLLDTIRHACLRLEHRLEVAANDTNDVSLANVLKDKVLPDVKGKRGECFSTIRDAIDAHSVDLCEPLHDADSWHEVLGTWNADITSARVRDVRMHLDVVGVSVLGETDPAETCTSPLEHNGRASSFAAISVSSTSLGLDAPVSFAVFGPEFGGEPIAGSGQADAPSSVFVKHLRQSGRWLAIERFEIDSKTPTRVGNGVVASDVSEFTITLLDTARARRVKRPDQARPRYVIAPGEAVFFLGAQVDGFGDSVSATNATPIRLRPVRPGTGTCSETADECWQISPFSVDYTDVFGSSWTLDVGSSAWSR